MKINFINKIKTVVSKKVKDDIRNAIRKIAAFENKKIIEEHSQIPFEDNNIN